MLNAESPAPESCLSPSFIPHPSSLPPSPRDFEIHRLALVEFLSTRRLAEKYEISQTRVRQIIAHVSDWLTEMLPMKSEQDIEKEKRFAIHLAAAQLRHQIQQLQNYFDGSGDPKYLRQQTRAIQALARLGAHSHTLDSLAANYSDASANTVTRSVSEGPDNHPITTAANTSAAAPTSSSEISNFQSQIPTPSPSSFSLHNSSFPPKAACSPSFSSSVTPPPSSLGEADLTPSPETDLLLQPEIAKNTLKGLDILERNLLTYIGQIDPQETERLTRLNESLAGIRQSRANFILRLGPNSPVTLPNDPPPAVSSAAQNPAAGNESLSTT